MMMSGKKAIVFFIMIICICIDAGSQPSSPAEDKNLMESIQKIAKAFSTSNINLITNFLDEGTRVYSDCEEVFSSKGYFGKAQLVLLLQNFFKNYEILGAQVSESEIKPLSEEKTLFKIFLAYKDRHSSQIMNLNIFFLLLKLPTSKNSQNPSGWIIIEIKKIN